jgi:hypothetical protein
MSHSLTSHEDLTPYIEELLRLSNQTQTGLERRRSFAAEPETIIKELLTELMTCRNNAQKAETIAKKFLEAYNTSVEDLARLRNKIREQGDDIGELNTLIQRYQKEIEVKDNRFESLTLEATDMERALKIINAECSQLKKEKEIIKKELQSKEQMLVARENAIQQRKNFLVEVEKEKEKDREKEVDKTLQIKHDQLLLANKKYLADVQDLNSRIEELEALWNLDKKENEKMKKSVGTLRDELFSKKIEYEELLQKYRECKDRVFSLKEELMMEKAHNESLLKENDRQKSSSFKVDFDNFEDQSSLKTEPFRRSRTEILSDFLGELEDSHKDEGGFFTLNTATSSSPKFVLINTKKTELLKPISVIPPKQVLTTSTFKQFNRCAKVLKLTSGDFFSFNLKTLLTEENQEKIKTQIPEFSESSELALHPKFPSESLELSTFPTKFKSTTLQIIKLDEIHLARVPIFNFDDAASEESTETVASRSRKMSVVENRDPIKQFFIFTCQAAKLNSVNKDKVGTIPVNKLYERVLQQGVPFNLWSEYINEYLNSRVKGKV